MFLLIILCVKRKKHWHLCWFESVTPLIKIANCKWKNRSWISHKLFEQIKHIFPKKSTSSLWFLVYIYEKRTEIYLITCSLNGFEFICQCTVHAICTNEAMEKVNQKNETESERERERMKELNETNKQMSPYSIHSISCQFGSNLLNTFVWPMAERINFKRSIHLYSVAHSMIKNVSGEAGGRNSREQKPDEHEEKKSPTF